MKKKIISLLNYFPRLKRTLKAMLNRIQRRGNVSTGYILLNGVEGRSQGYSLGSSWQDESLPKKQRVLAEEQLTQYRDGESIPVFDVLVNALNGLPDLKPNASLLEIGCSSGFYSEVFDIAGMKLQYTGYDYSAAFIRLAKDKYPDIPFSVNDATDLDCADETFDVVVSGCCLLHIPEYKSAIKESVRVSKQYVIFHRTPVVWGMPEQWYRKYAYGVETVEIHFNEQDFLELLKINHLEILQAFTFSEEFEDGNRSVGRAVRTYVCEKLN